MASGEVIPPPPPGFKLDAVPPPPPGFKLDAPVEAPQITGSVAGLNGTSVAPPGSFSPTTRTGLSWTNEAIAGIPDALLNTPTNVMNLLKAGVGAPLVAAGRADLAPEPSKTPDYITRLFERAGLIDRSLDPTTTGGRIAKGALQAGVTGAIAPAQGVRQAVANMTHAGIAGTVGQSTTEATGNQELGMAANLATTPLLTARRNSSIRQEQAQDRRQSVKRDTMEDARAEGYVTPPSAVNPSFVGNRLESVAGKAALNQEAVNRNQEVTNRIVRREIGLAEDAPITPQALQQRRDVLAEPYREVTALSPTAAQALERLRDVRQQATAYWRHYDVSATPDSQRIARQLDNQAAMLERVIERQAQRAGRPELVGQLREARRDIARTYDVERALNIGDGNVHANIIGRAADRNPGRLTGGLATIGRFAEAFPSLARGAAGNPAPGVSAMEPALMAGFGVAGSPVVGGLPLLAHPMRAGLLSNVYQNAIQPRPNTSPLLTDTYLRGLLSTQGQQ